MDRTFTPNEENERMQMHAHLRVLDERLAVLAAQLTDIHKSYRETKQAARGVREHLQDEEVRRVAPRLFAALNTGPRAYIKRCLVDPCGFIVMKHDGLAKRLVDMVRDGPINAARVNIIIIINYYYY